MKEINRFMKIGVYVGSFNPVHKGHIKVVKKVLKEYVDKVLIVPTLSYWDKNNLISITDRINMLKLYETENILIDTKNNKCKFTYQVLRNIKHEYEDSKIYLIIGDDLLEYFDKWKNVDEILSNYNLIVIMRNNIDASVYQKYKNYNLIVTSKISENEISSTIVRSMVSNNNDEVLKCIDSKVYDYIKRNNLYVS